MPSWIAATGALAAFLTTVGMAPAMAQHHAHGAGHGHGHAAHHAPQQGHASPYAGMQTRDIKALSEQQIAGLRGGKGMAMAMAAELNGYPGPLHVLELADALALTPVQRSHTQALFNEMEAQAKAAGEAVIAAERALDVLFRARQATPETLTAAVQHAAQAQGTLRETHLRYHLRMVEVLSPEQVQAYNRLRGY